MELHLSFRGRRALVTGAGKGIGRAVAVALSRAGARVTALSRTGADLESLTRECPGIETLCLDLADWEAVEAAVGAAGPFELLVNNAAVAELQPFLEVTRSALQRSLDVNFGAVLHVSQIVARQMIAQGVQGAIVNVSSQASKRALRDHAVYCSTKSALDMLSKVMAMELGPHKIRVNTVNPTVVMTDMGRINWSDPQKSAAMINRIPLGKFAEVEDVVNSILFLLSDKSAMTTGSSLMIDGGFLAVGRAQPGWLHQTPSSSPAVSGQSIQGTLPTLGKESSSSTTPVLAPYTVPHPLTKFNATDICLLMRLTDLPSHGQALGIGDGGQFLITQMRSLKKAFPKSLEKKAKRVTRSTWRNQKEQRISPQNNQQKDIRNL
ncbi:hypothetical protein IHE44_0007021 [Lamprotornis superbus]|uniref:L-xylulose reductase n=1 Tax=Lamprotornis superbus TaxID=245042 RepID=A0A835NUJ1_9PASS|nr:hypothetical protein IHE44_0007021 [Lamprotornis superbus]